MLIESRITNALTTIKSKFLKRDVALSFFIHKDSSKSVALPLLIINDGQDVPTMQLDNILDQLYHRQAIVPLCCVAVSAGKDRTQEYGVSEKKDYMNRGAKALAYTRFVIEELLPFIKNTYAHTRFTETALAGFSLGGLSALDISWNNAHIFSRVGVFSGSLWWRSLDMNDKAYSDNKHRIIHQQIRNGTYQPGLKFFFQCGKMDESGDRNNNGIIDSIDDTLDLIKELLNKGYQPEDISYLELDDGKHDVATWSRSMPVFLKWGWGTSNK